MRHPSKPLKYVPSLDVSAVEESLSLAHHKNAICRSIIYVVWFFCFSFNTDSS